MNYANAGAGLRKLFIAQIGSVVCSVLLVIPLINLAGAIGALVFLILSLIGLNEAGKDIEGCKKAFQITIVQLALTVISIFTGSGILDTLVSAAVIITGFLSTYFVCSSVAAVLRTCSHDDIAAKGELVWKINLICYAARILVSLLSRIPLLNILAFPASIVVPIASLIAGILFIVFLYNSSEVLQ